MIKPIVIVDKQHGKGLGRPICKQYKCYTQKDLGEAAILFIKGAVSIRTSI